MNPPRLLELKPPVLDFGTVHQGTTLRGSVVLANGAAHEVHGIEIIKSCTCTDIDFSPKTIAPGDSAPASVELTTDRAGGNYEQTLLVNYRLGSDPAIHRLPLPVRATVTPEVTMLPHRELTFESDKEATCKITLKSNGPEEVLLQRAYSNSTAIVVERFAGGSSGGQQGIHVSYLPSEWNRIAASAEITP